MKAITVKQPYAFLLSVGAKRYETRSWSTPYRGPIAIHAGKDTTDAHNLALSSRWHLEKQKPLPPLVGAVREVVLKHLPDGRSKWIDVLCFGEVIAVAELVAVHYYEPPNLSEQERLFGFYGDGRYAWEIANVQQLTMPIPARGQLGLWQWSQP